MRKKIMESGECSICGGKKFVPGYNGRLSRTGLPPQCNTCGAVERHRIIFNIYECLKDITIHMSVLQFAPDNTLSPTNFKSFDTSNYQGENHLEMMGTGLVDSSFDLLVSNHVIEHVSDDITALRECLRVVGPSGIVHICAPSPIETVITNDWGFADESKTMHYRNYGADMGVRFCNEIDDLSGLAVFGMDEVTSVYDVIFFFSRSNERLMEILKPLQKSRFPAVFVGA